MGTWKSATRFIVKGFHHTHQEDIMLTLDELLIRINFMVGIDDQHCCLKHQCMQHVLIILNQMMKQRCDHSFTPFSYKQCKNCNLTAKEDEKFCWGCDADKFRLAKPTVMLL